MSGWFAAAHAALADFVALGGWVVALLLAISVIAGAAVLWKLWDLAMLRVGPHPALAAALADWQAGQRGAAAARLAAGRSALDRLAARAMAAGAPETLRPRLQAETEAHAARAEAGLRLLDAIAQTAPLLGLFGTVLGMIEAFQTLQAGGSSVDPSQLAGGIWVALLTTAMGLGIAMPVSLFLSWTESRIAREAQGAALMVEVLCGPALPETPETASRPLVAVQG
ncbi:MotA/TolQ/ExbB proton channel family protein [Sinirhodobacter ferrireducens]|uniref:MotA/TolQ/ExbB proton channel family protein n=1 Tax=Paenirhodobacter ferrireducens TaxID=1215032 RepID=A0A443LS07_9RHOB|nr:MotA/TolQ/ExbB proton channel family protein [Sinirhodobacter ferrireducens]RWR51963.1 MotA/TolQ/ExbB proton channel family protein [Sinirhodobacter ferrireducens]